MSKTVIAFAAAGAVLAATPVMAGEHLTRANLFTDSNSHYLDYKTSLSEARRELRSDLARAHDEQDRIDAKSEYDREVADAKHDFRKEMAERGFYVAPNDLREGHVTVEEMAAR
ncbi:hypothetical protein KY084_12755 [Stakelama sp. CBK3Z-3]|uniref:DUF4148 domain-containing protein n=1 Tax=Stakelama flava TaxID=2860338 RepID=A0ABS6XQQ4_9SPHN|nr:hypothetical protein [Stakelama flava]MBW4331741.1 hypothetical protein [Stakelama flava]